ncbi:MAG: sporulation protein YabP [Oscillospiraceae bacterium]|nr:sporulation protein YabP [Oscillospiraceae bacterium]
MEYEAPHRLSMEDRGQLKISGVSDVDSFDEQTIVLQTSRGTLIVHGSQLHLQTLSLESGQIEIDGIVDALTYEDGHRESGSFFARLFR